jgi:hypothetical protein
MFIIIGERRKLFMRRKEDKSETFTLNNAMAVLAAEGVKMTKMGLRQAAARDGFKSNIRGEGREKYLLDKDNFFIWLQKLDNFAPDGFVETRSFAKEKDISTSYVYSLIKQHKIETRTFGGGRGKFFFNAKQVEKLLGKKKNKYKSLVKRARLSFKSRYNGYEDFLSSVV